MDETRVRYKVLADFIALNRATRTARRNLRELREEEERGNAQSVAGAARAIIANQKRAASIRDLTDAYRDQESAVARSARGFIENSRAARQAAESSRAQADSVEDAADATESLAGATRRAVRETLNARSATDAASSSLDRNSRSHRNNQREMGRTLTMVDTLNRQFRRLGNWRPHLTPPFVALIPIIAGVLGLINPLVAGLGAVGGAAIGFASSLGQLGGAAVAIVPALATLLTIVTALKTSFGGIGNAFKAFQQMKEATGAGSGPAKAELSRTEEITRAQERQARAIQDVAWAQEDLDDARRDYIKRLAELQRAVDRAAASEMRAAANAQLARENYANVLADPGSTKGQKMDAKAGVEEANQAYSDTIRENKENAAELAEMKRKGMDGDREVIRAQRALTDAIWAQRDAQLALINAQTGASSTQSAQTTAINAYEQALSKLSPSARRFVETILAMSDAWTTLKRNVQERFFSQFVDNVDRLRLLFGPLESLLGDAAEALGRFVDKFLLLITSPEWQSDIILFGKGNVPIIDAMGDGILALLDAFRNVAIAAQPFLQALVEGLRDASEEFRALTEQGRQSGGLADYLERVRQRLAQWWRIIRNIAKTLTNYGTAAGDFADWITSGLERTTEGWLDASERALGPDSAFRKWLEDIKPLLSEIKGLFADFFGWFAEESADTDNISQMTNIIRSIRDELGPAIGRLLDRLADAQVGPLFVDAVTKLVEIITELSNSPAIHVFFDVLNALLEVAKWVVANPILGTLLGSIAAGFAALAAISFVGKFSGLTALINLLLNFAKGGQGLPGLLRGIAASLGIMIPAAAGAVGAAGSAAGGAVFGAGTRRGRGGGSGAPAVLPGMTRADYRSAGRRPVAGGGIAGILLSALMVLPDLVSNMKRSQSNVYGAGTRRGAGGGSGAPGVVAGESRSQYRARTGGAKGFDLLGSVGRGAGRGVGIAAIASIAATVIGDLISSGAASGAAGAGRGHRCSPWHAYPHSRRRHGRRRGGRWGRRWSRWTGHGGRSRPRQDVRGDGQLLPGRRPVDLGRLGPVLELAHR
jgi:hypothetical protein